MDESDKITSRGRTIDELTNSEKYYVGAVLNECESIDEILLLGDSINVYSEHSGIIDPDVFRLLDGTALVPNSVSNVTAGQTRLRVTVTDNAEN